VPVADAGIMMRGAGGRKCVSTRSSLIASAHAEPRVFHTGKGDYKCWLNWIICGRTYGQISTR